MKTAPATSAAPCHPAPELAELVSDLGPLGAHVQTMTTTPRGFMVRMHRDTPRAALEAAYRVFDNHAARRVDRGPVTAPARSPRQPRGRRAAP